MRVSRVGILLRQQFRLPLLIENDAAAGYSFRDRDWKICVNSPIIAEPELYHASPIAAGIVANNFQIAAAAARILQPALIATIMPKNQRILSLARTRTHYG